MPKFQVEIEIQRKPEIRALEINARDPKKAYTQAEDIIANWHDVEKKKIGNIYEIDD